MFLTNANEVGIGKIPTFSRSQYKQIRKLILSNPSSFLSLFAPEEALELFNQVWFK